MEHRNLLVATVVLGTALGCLACGEDERPTAPGPTATSPARGVLTAPTSRSAEPTVLDTGSAPEPADDEAEVLAAVDCYWETIAEANDPPNPDHPGFERCFTGAALERSRAKVQGHLDHGRTVRYPNGAIWVMTDGVRVVGDRAEVIQCLVDDAVVVDAATGRTLNDEIVSAKVRIDLVHGTSWRVEESRVIGEIKEGRSCVHALRSS